MAKKVIASHLNLKPGSSFRLAGDILPKAVRFGIEMGTDKNNIALHFNPRFCYSSDKNVIVYNSMYEGRYGKEERDRHFPFQMNSWTEVCIEFEGSFFAVNLSDGSRRTFPNRLETTEITYISVFGDIETRSLVFT